MIAVSFLIGALGRRIAGGAFQQWTGWDIGDHLVRLFFGATVAASAAMGGAGWWSLLLVLAVWIGCTIPMGGIGLGRQPGGSWLHDAAGLTMHGVATGVLCALALTEWPPHVVASAMIVAGVFIVPAYEIGWRMARPTFPLGFRQGSEIGEALWGGTIAVGAYLIGG